VCIGTSSCAPLGAACTTSTACCSQLCDVTLHCVAPPV
jgi:hypothetical protein